MAADKVKFGIVGTGAIARFHAQALHQSPNAELFMVYDLDQERAARFAAEYGCRAAATPEEFIASEIEAVTIGTPSGLHAAAALPMARGGKHILCEKPLDVTTRAADELIAACEKAGVLLSVVCQSRFLKNVRLIRQAVAAGRFGEPVFCSAAMHWYRSPEYYASATWRGTWKLDGGGALMNQGVHTVDLLLHFNGDVAEVTGGTARRRHAAIEVEDTAAALLKFRNGSFGTITASTACAPGFPRRVELTGTTGSAVLVDDRLERWSFCTEEPGDEAIREAGRGGEGGIVGGSSDPNAMSCEGHVRQIVELADAIRERGRLSLPGREGRRVVELICAVYDSARTGRTVKL